MSEQTGSNQQTPAGQPGNASPAGEQSAGQQPQYLTRDEALRLVREELTKTSQSITDRVSAQVRKVIDAAAAKGVTMTPEQAQAVLDATAAGTQPAPKPATLPPAQREQPPPSLREGPPAAQTQQLDETTTEAVRILKEEFRLVDFDPDNLDPDEPEYKLLNMDTDDPQAFLASVRVYGEAKAKKQQEAGTPARLPSLASGGQASRQNPYDGMKGTDILNQAYRKTT